MPPIMLGETFLGRDVETWGEGTTGWIPISLPSSPSSPPRHLPGASGAPLIHVGIASYRDSLCPRTLHNLFAKALHPENLRVLIIEQTDPTSTSLDDASIFAQYCGNYNADCEALSEQIVIVNIDSRTSKGPTDARSKLSMLIEQEYLNGRLELTDYVLQIDSHMDFVKNFDSELVAMHHRTNNEYAILSTYVSPIEETDGALDKKEVPLLCMVTFTATIRNWGTKACRGLVSPKLTNSLWGAGLSFHRVHAEINVPVDPFLDFVFDGEEGSRSVRFFTSGYDVYAPDKVLVTHDYKGHQSTGVVHSWSSNKKGRKSGGGGDGEAWPWSGIGLIGENIAIKETQRVNLLLGIPLKGQEARGTEEVEEMRRVLRRSKFGLGNKRSVEQWEKFSGIDLGGRRMVENKCGNLEWVPWEGEIDTVELLRRPMWDEQVVERVRVDRVGVERGGGSGKWDDGVGHLREHVGMCLACLTLLMGAKWCSKKSKVKNRVVEDRDLMV